MSTSSQAVLPTLDRKLSLASRAASPPARVHSARTPHRERGRASAPPPHPRVARSPHHALFGARAALVRMNPSTRASATAPRCGRPRPHMNSTPFCARAASVRPPPRQPVLAPPPVRRRARRLRRRRNRVAAGCGGRGRGHTTCAPACCPRRTPPTPSGCSVHRAAPGSVASTHGACASHGWRRRRRRSGSCAHDASSDETLPTCSRRHVGPALALPAQSARCGRARRDDAMRRRPRPAAIPLSWGGAATWRCGHHGTLLVALGMPG